MKKKKKKTGLNGYIIDYNIIDTSIIDICKYLMKKHDLK